jgi:hypothetical protein
MEDKILAMYKKRVWEKVQEVDRTVIPSGWWETVIKHYYELGYSEEETVRVVRETMMKK